MTDSATGITTTYYYDFTERMMKYVETGTDYTHSVGYEYDTRNNLTQLVENIDGVEKTTSYTYDDDNRVTSVTTDGTTVSYAYDGFGRVTTQTTKNGDTVILTESFTYVNPTATTTSNQIATYTTTAGSYSVTYTYTYDDNGNILTISDGTNTTSYVYDSANQLIRENNQAGNYTYTWEYDNAGNILYRRMYAYTTGELGTVQDTHSYWYDDDSWGDLLSEGGASGSGKANDEIGNLIFDGPRCFYWEHGRELVRIFDECTEWIYWDMEYDANGMRTQRSNDTDTYTYVYNGSQLTRMTKNTDTLYFTYDAAGTPLTLNYNGTVYYYATNIQGDVVAILDSTGTAVVSYTYDAWGNPLSRTGTMVSTLGILNPLRYRGYVYDQETGLYYLQSRYYDPELGRFISADKFVSTGRGLIGYNMFAYANNNPVICSDFSGQSPWVIVGILAVFVIAGGVLGALYDGKLGSTTEKQEINTAPPEVLPPGDANELIPEKETPLQSDVLQPTKDESLSVGDRVKNAAVGASLGLAVGGAIVATGGAVLCVAGYATTTVVAFGMTGMQIFATGAVAYNIFSMVIAPFFGVEMETIEYEP